MTEVLDYSAGFPGAENIANAHYAGAVRYIGFPGRHKCATAGELADFDAHDRGMALVFEDTLTRWRGGRTAGAVDARLGRNHATAIGWPAGRPLYMAIDQDVVGFGEMATAMDYLRGAADTLGDPRLVGVYGEADVIDRARDEGLAGYFWQTAAWSRGRRTTANLFQRIGTVYVGGIACDVNDALTPDWGQHNYVMEDDMSWNESLTLDAPDGKQYTYTAAQWVTWTNWWANQIPALQAQVSALSAAVAQVSTNPNVTVDELTRIVNDAIVQHVQITGTINIGPATPSAAPAAP